MERAAEAVAGRVASTRCRTSTTTTSWPSGMCCAGAPPTPGCRRSLSCAPSSGRWMSSSSLCHRGQRLLRSCLPCRTLRPASRTQVVAAAVAAWRVLSNLWRLQPLSRLRQDVVRSFPPRGAPLAPRGVPPAPARRRQLRRRSPSRRSSRCLRLAAVAAVPPPPQLQAASAASRRRRPAVDSAQRRGRVPLETRWMNVFISDEG
mmetsp:Transcript_64121/g.161556  ORF Transcript_64121/g.161556 Transcript_64121/m.161556 type:complete len:204 (+) Transcript_64121:153-764(+)